MKCPNCKYKSDLEYNYNLEEFVNIDGECGSFYSCNHMKRLNKCYNPPINTELLEEIVMFGCPQCGHVFVDLKKEYTYERTGT